MTQAVDLFAGPGGLDEGARTLGVPCLGVEWDANAVATRIAAGHPTVHGDVRKYGPADLPGDTLAAGPPCQTFTIAGDGAGRRDLDTVLDLAKRRAARQDITADLARLNDERTGLVLEPLRWALEAIDARRPYRAIVLEQVPAALPVWQAYAEHLEAEGYRAAVGILKAEQYGVPQTRRRAVAVFRLDGPARLPRPYHRPYRKGVPQADGDTALRPWRSMADTLDRGKPFAVVSNYGTGGDPKNRGRRTHDEPSATVTGKISRARVVDPHGNELPRFTHAEAGQLQSFRANYPWAGAHIPQQIGNAMPPMLAAHVLAAALDLPAPRRNP